MTPFLRPALTDGAFLWNIPRAGSLCAWRHAMDMRSLPGGLSDDLAFEPRGTSQRLKPRIPPECGASLMLGPRAPRQK